MLRLEIVNVAGRRWQWGEDSLVELALALDELGFEFEDPDSARVGRLGALPQTTPPTWPSPKSA